MSSYDLRQFILDIPLFRKENYVPEIEEIRIFRKDDKTKGFVCFHNYENANKVNNFFNNPIKKKSVPSRNSKGEIIEARNILNLGKLGL